MTLQQALQEYGLSLTPRQQTQLTRYCESLWDWNERVSLTRHTTWDAFVRRDLHDSMHLARWLQKSEHVLDAGSGGGVPGIVLAIVRDDLHVSLAESTQKKAAALRDMVARAGLNVRVFAERAEQVTAGQNFHTVTARAVAPLAKLLSWFHPTCSGWRRLLLIKGPQWKQERQAAEAAGVLQGLHVDVLDTYTTRGHDGESVILQVRASSGHRSGPSVRRSRTKV